MLEFWKGLSIFKKVVAIICVIAAVLTIIYGFKYLITTWKNDKIAIIGLGIIMIYVFPIIYFFWQEVKAKHKQIIKILKENNEAERKEKLMEFDYYTFPKFIAEIFKQYNAMLVFIFVQLFMIQIAEIEISAVDTMIIYMFFIATSTFLCVCIYFVIGSRVLSISTESFSRKRHVEYVLKTGEYLIRKKEKTIKINWSEPYEIETVIQNEFKHKQVLYYITRIFGKKETSLYLGNVHGESTIKDILNEHRKEWLKKYRGKIHVRIGTVLGPTNCSDSVLNYVSNAILFEQGKLFSENILETELFATMDIGRIENIGSIFDLKPVIEINS